MTDIDFNPRSVDAAGSFGRAWEMVKQSYWMYLGMSVLAFIFCTYFYCISWFLVGPVMAGIFFVVLRQLRGEAVDFGMLFKGFEKFVPLMVVGLLQSIPDMIILILSLALNVGQLFFLFAGKKGNVDFLQRSDSPDMVQAQALFGVIMFAWLGLMVLTYVWRTVFFFAIPLILENDLAPLDAIKLSARASMANIGGLISFFIFEALVILFGTIMICLGVIFFSLPVIYVARALVYRNVFPPIERNINLDPPPPTAYGAGSFGIGQ